MTGICRAYTSCRHGQLHYRTAGVARPGGAPALVMLHQNPSSSLEYEPLIARLAADRLVVAFDTPGNGMSDDPPAPLTIEGYAEAFADGIAALGLAGPLDLFGYHTGSYLALGLARVRPDLVGRIVVSGIPMRDRQERATKFADAQAVPEDEDGAATLAWLGWLWDYIVVQRTAGVPLRRATRLFADKARPLHRRAWPYQAVWSWDAEALLPGIAHPVLILQPEEPLTGPSRAAAALLPNARFVHLPGLGRDVFEVGADIFADEMRSFLCPISPHPPQPPR